MNSLRKLSLASIACLAAVIAACSTPQSSAVKPTLTAHQVVDISGDWLLIVQSPTGTVAAKMTVIQTGSAIKGTLDSSMGVVDFAGAIHDNEVQFTYSVDKFGAPAGTNFNYVGTVEQGVMSGAAQFSSFGEGKWSAKRP